MVREPLVWLSGPVLDAAHVIGTITAENTRDDRPLDKLAEQVTGKLAVEIVD
jgi:hypothetical protein